MEKLSVTVWYRSPNAILAQIKNCQVE